MCWEEMNVIHQIGIRWKNSQKKNQNKTKQTVSQEGNIGNIIYKAKLLNKNIIWIRMPVYFCQPHLRNLQMSRM